MKQIFFTFVAITLPLMVVGGLIYMFGHGIYSLVSDWRLNRELKELRSEYEARRRKTPNQAPQSSDPEDIFK